MMNRVSREQFVNIARSAIGVPYVAGQSTAHGCDCVGLLIHIARELELPHRVEAYETTPQGNQLLEELAANGLVEKVKENRLPGDVLVFWIGTPHTQIPRHIGIFDGERMIHACNLYHHKVVCDRLGEKWESRLVAVFKLEQWED